MENSKVDSFGFIYKEEVKSSNSKSTDKKGNARLEKWRVAKNKKQCIPNEINKIN
jgi:hypothetical protein